MAPEPTIGEALRDATAAFAASGSATPRLDAEVLLAHHVQQGRAWVIAHPEATLPAPDAWAELVRRRADGEPIAYLRGFKEWRGLRLAVDRRALSPRPETELLADAAIVEIERRLDRADDVVAWEVATGSGAIAVAAGTHHATSLRTHRLRLVASDLSADALALARENLAAHGIGEMVETVVGDGLASAGAALPLPDVVIANLPYVPTADVDAAGPLLAHEPRLALDGGADGLAVIRPFLAAAPGRVARGASLLLEVGAGQATAVAAMAPPGASVSTLADLAGVERVVRIDMAD